MRKVLFFSIRTPIHTRIYFSANTTTSKKKKLRINPIITTTSSTHHNELALLFLSQKHTIALSHKINSSQVTSFDSFISQSHSHTNTKFHSFCIILIGAQVSGYETKSAKSRSVQLAEMEECEYLRLGF